MPEELNETEPIPIPVPNPVDPDDGESNNPGGDPQMAVDATINTAMEGVIVSQAQGHAFTMEQGRLNTLEGKTGYREGLSHRIISESGAGQARAQLPGALGGVPTVVGPSTTT